MWPSSAALLAEKQVNVHRVNRWIPLLLAAGLTVLAMCLESLWFALFYALLYGMITVVKATAMATYASQPRAASLSGLLTFPVAIVRAAVPSLLAILWTATGDYLLALAVFSALAMVSVAAIWVAQRRALRPI